MKLLTEIMDEEYPNQYEVSYKVRKASRAVILNEKKQIAVLYVSRDNYHKLPGGGIEENESIFMALHREVLEEVGAIVEVKEAVGVIIEYRNYFKQLQISYCFLATLKALSSSNLTDYEKNEVFILKWMSLEEALLSVKNDQPTTYMGRFIKKRDYSFLLEAKELLIQDNKNH